MPDRPIFETAPTLPRGPHRLTREEVAASQRARLQAAIAELLAERGFAAITIGDLVARAGVSRAAFYAHFADKEACLLAAYDRFAERVVGALTPDLPDDTPWEEFVRVVLGNYLAVIEGDPSSARAFVVEMDAAGPAARARRREALRGFAGLLAQRHAAIRRSNPSLGPLPDTAYLVLALGVRDLVQDVLQHDPAPDLRALADDLVLFATAVVEGAAAAGGP